MLDVTLLVDVLTLVLLLVFVAVLFMVVLLVLRLVLLLLLVVVFTLLLLLVFTLVLLEVTVDVVVVVLVMLESSPNATLVTIPKAIPIMAYSRNLIVIPSSPLVSQESTEFNFFLPRSSRFCQIFGSIICLNYHLLIK